MVNDGLAIESGGACALSTRAAFAAASIAVATALNEAGHSIIKPGESLAGRVICLVLPGPQLQLPSPQRSRGVSFSATTRASRRLSSASLLPQPLLIFFQALLPHLLRFRAMSPVPLGIALGPRLVSLLVVVPLVLALLLSTILPLLLLFSPLVLLHGTGTGLTQLRPLPLCGWPKTWHPDQHSRGHARKKTVNQLPKVSNARSIGVLVTRSG